MELSAHNYHIVEQQGPSCSDDDEYEPVQFGKSDGSSDDWSSEYEDVETRDVPAAKNSSSFDQVDSIQV